jgi:hypothetical protein
MCYQIEHRFYVFEFHLQNSNTNIAVFCVILDVMKSFLLQKQNCLSNNSSNASAAAMAIEDLIVLKIY